MTPVRLEPAASRSQVKHSTTEPLRSNKYMDLTLFILLDFPKHSDTISMEWSILCFKGSQVEISKLRWIYVS